MACAALTLSSLPLFPLACVLFPGGALGLRVFEPRYLEMARKCRQAGAPFGVVALTSGQEVRQAGAPEERFHAIGTLALIEQLERPQAGLMHLQCRGGERFRIQRSQRLPQGLWLADVERMAPERTLPIPEDLQKTAAALAQLLLRLQGRDPDKPSAITPTPAQLADCGWVANRWCELLPLPLELKQALMQLDNPLLRLELVGDTLDRLGIAEGW